MSETETEKKYHERYIRWSDKTREQLSFFNNLLFTLSVGFLSFAYKNLLNTKIEFSFCHPKFSTTLLVFSIISIALSVFVGLKCAISRLYDFRITSHINQVRYWALKHSTIILNENSSILYSKFHRKILLICLLFNDYKKIKIEDCKNLKYIKPDERFEFSMIFNRLRAISHNLGLGTWNKLKWQIGLFFIGITAFVVAQICLIYQSQT